MYSENMNEISKDVDESSLCVYVMTVPPVGS